MAPEKERELARSELDWRLVERSDGALVLEVVVQSSFVWFALSHELSESESTEFRALRPTSKKARRYLELLAQTVRSRQR